jgi:hypothetical protein
MAKSKIVTVRGRKYYRAAREFKPTWRNKQVELDSAKLDLDAALSCLDARSLDVRNATAWVSRASKRFNNANEALKPKRKTKS